MKSAVNMPGIAVIAATNSSYVTAASSVALVLGTLGFVAGGTLLAARAQMQSLNQEGSSNGATPSKRPRIKPLQAKQQSSSVTPPPSPGTIDEKEF